ncbi:hypothetical protein RYZ26_17190 [Terasakiella sp. A23]|uniref:hypothetical protein n=1 Tax=Terasakiella sp. FCG-A23 TaxID=3080561 RepID=UPI002955920F|nr:hypothetical protein [Terasakiella sp. A23]MDV7341347.1 hypothetical protein [Terasakiella sp. A23]
MKKIVLSSKEMESIQTLINVTSKLRGTGIEKRIIDLMHDLMQADQNNMILIED